VRAHNPAFAEEYFSGAYPELIPLIRMTAQEYKETVKDSAIGWIRRTRIRRNAAIAAGNLRSEEAVEALAEMLRDENPMLRATAAWALGEIGSPESLRVLQIALQSEQDETAAEEIREALDQPCN
jgi:epoxyqueuosine reductase